MQFLAIRGRLVFDHEGEGKVTFVVSQQEASKLSEIPTEEVLKITVENE